MREAASVDIVRLDGGRASVADRILRDLPDWFGIENAIRDYVAAVPSKPTFEAHVGGDTVGFLTLERHTPIHAEIHVMGVLSSWHGRGTGRRLVQAAEAWASDGGCRFLSVKTLSARHPDRHYAATRRFYEAMGFEPFEEFPELWGISNPCLLMLKALP